MVNDNLTRYDLLSGSNLAFVGDAYYELQIRQYLIDNKITNSSELKKMSVKYVSAHAHQLICDQLLSELTDEELHVFKRGRNGAHHNYRKNLNYAEYNNSTGLEALIGYLYLLKKDERLKEIIDKSIKIIEKGNV